MLKHVLKVCLKNVLILIILVFINKNVDDIFKSIISHKATMISPTNESLTSRSVKLQSKGYDVEIPAFVPMMEAGSINKPDPLPIIFKS